MKAGDEVVILGRKRKLVRPLDGIQGGWLIDKPVEGFRHWNTNDCKVWRPLSKGGLPAA